MAFYDPGSITRTALGNTVENLSNMFKVPFEFGVSEAISGYRPGGQSYQTAQNNLQTYASGTPSPNVGPQSYYSSSASGPMSTAYGVAGPRPVNQSSPTTYQTQTQSSGGPSDSRLQELSKTDRNPAQETEYQALLAAAQTGPSEAEINSVYNPLMQTLGSAEERLRADLPGYQQEVRDLYGNQLQSLQTGRDTTLSTLAGQGEQVGTRQRNVIADARQLFNELQQGNIQRFGGASSAGQFASELQGREFQRQQGQAGQQAGQAMREIEQQRVAVDREFGDKQQALETQKQVALSDLQRRFQDSLAEINSQRGQLESAKAGQRLQALQEYRNNLFNINSQITQFQQQLAMNRQQAQLEIEAAAKQYGSASAGGQSSLESMLSGTEGLGRTNLGFGPQSGQAQTQLTGRINPEDPLSYQGYIPGSSERDPRFAQYIPRQ